MINFDSEMIEFEKELQLQLINELNKVTNEIEVSLKDNIQSQLYSSYDPIYYSRSNQMQNGLTKNVDISKFEGVVKFDESKMNHINNQDVKIDDKLPSWLENGYKFPNWNGGNDYYHQRPSSNFTSKTVSDINNKYGEIVCEVIDE